MFDAFRTRAEAVSAEVHRFPTKSAALDFILGFLRLEGVADVPQSYALWADSPFLKGLEKGQLSERVPGLKFEVTRELAAEAKVGISQMDWAMADTGTLVQDSTQAEQRLVSTLPAIHIALLPDGSNPAGSADSFKEGEARKERLPCHDNRAEPDFRYRARVDHRSSRTGATDRRSRGRAWGDELMAISRKFRRKINKALHSTTLTGALGRFSEAYRISRAQAYEGIDFEALRGKIAEIKSSAASHFDELAEQFKERPRPKGPRCFGPAAPRRSRNTS